MKPRFERLEGILGKPGALIQQDEKHPNDYHFHVQDDPEFDLKRIDHRHHAMDALIIAATTREHIRYLNSLNAVDTSEDLKRVKQNLVKGKIRQFAKPWESFTEDAKENLSTIITSIKANNKVVSKPKNKYQKWVEKEPNKWVKESVKQEKPKDPSKKWLAVRKSMFKEPQGIIYLKEVYEEKSIDKAVEIQMNRMKVQNTPAMNIASYIYDKEAREIARTLILEHDFDLEAIKKHLKKSPLKNGSKKEYKAIRVARFKEYAAKRVSLDKSFDHKKINKIPYSKSIIPTLLHNHLFEYHKSITKLGPKFWENENVTLDKQQEKAIKEASNLAFSGEGLDNLNKKFKHPITKVTIYEKKSPEDKFKNNYVEVDAGANVYFIMYENIQTSERNEMYSLAAHKAIERLVQGLPIADSREGFKTIILSPNQLVYVPTPEEILKPELIDLETTDMKKRKEIFSRIYKMVSCTKKECQFIPHNISFPIISTTELGANDKSEKAWDGRIEYLPNSKNKVSRSNSGTIIKDICIKLKTDRLGNIKRS